MYQSKVAHRVSDDSKLDRVYNDSLSVSAVDE
jgi:hypothetical protein